MVCVALRVCGPRSAEVVGCGAAVRGPLGAARVRAKRLTSRGLLYCDDPLVAATHFNWLIMSEPPNRAVFLHDAAVPDPAELQRWADTGVQTFVCVRETLVTFRGGGPFEELLQRPEAHRHRRIVRIGR